MKISRRQFSRSLGLGLAGVACAGAPFSRAQQWGRPFSGAPIGPFPKLGFDGFFVGQRGPEQAQAIVEAAIDEGFTFFDNAATYIEGRSERRYGFYLTPKYRDRVFLQSRAKPRTKLVAGADIDLALARHQTDYLDSFMMNSVVYYHRDHQIEMPDEDVFEALIEAKQAGKVRFIGLRAERDTEELCRILERYGEQVDSIMLPFELSSDDSAFAAANQLDIPVIGGIDDSAKPHDLEAVEAGAWLPSHFASRILRLVDPDKVRAHARIAREMGGLA